MGKMKGRAERYLPGVVGHPLENAIRDDDRLCFVDGMGVRKAEREIVAEHPIHFDSERRHFGIGMVNNDSGCKEAISDLDICLPFLEKACRL